MSLIYKIVSAEEWAQARAQGWFKGAAIDRRDGYIHLSSAAQVQETARLHFHGQAGLVLVTFESETLGPALKWEPSRAGALFPHFYGPLNVELARQCRPVALDADGAPRLDL